jgi:hypothetical protein
MNSARVLRSDSQTVFGALAQTTSIRPLAGGILFAALALPVVRHALERVMIVHMLVQIPLLAVAGALIVGAVPATMQARLVACNRRGASGMLLALIASSWWMVPRALDAALADPSMELAKFISLPLLVGMPLALSWPHVPGMGRGFVIANVLPMWVVVGWLYVAAPTRLCNFYLVDQQVTAGFGLLWASAALALALGLAAFRSVPSST